MAEANNVCGTGGWTGALPGDPDNNSVLSATPAFGGIDVSWTYPVLNPAAVAHTLLYRGLTNSFNTATLRQVVAGNFFYDKTTLDIPIEYFYWIRIVSVNGTEGELIGPASATARPTIEQMITLLTGQIDAGVLAQSLKTEIARIALIDGDMTDEITNRLSSYAALSAAFADAQASAEEVMTFIGQEVNARVDGDAALVDSIDLLYAQSGDNAAALLEETTLRVTKDAAQALATSDLAVQMGTDIAAAVSTETTARTTADSALSSQITTAQSVLNDNIASVQTSLQTNIDGVTGIMSGMYTAKVGVNGLIGGFGIYNDSQYVQAGFDVDTFWVGRTAANKRKPFIIDTNGQTYIDDAVINKLTFSKLRDESGSFIVENGKIKADYLRVQQITSGAYTSYAWPVNSTGGGFYLGPGGLLMGDYRAGKYVQIDANGNIYAPGFKVENATLTIDQANVIKTLNIAGNAVTVPITSQGGSMSGTGLGNFRIINEGWIYLDQPGLIYAHCLASQWYGTGLRYWDMKIEISGNWGMAIGGASVTVAPAVSISRYVGAGSHYVRVWWAGEDAGVRISDSEMFVMGAKR